MEQQLAAWIRRCGGGGLPPTRFGTLKRHVPRLGVAGAVIALLAMGLPDDAARHRIDPAQGTPIIDEPGAGLLRIVRPDGEIRTVWVDGRVICDESGEPYQFVGHARDVTDRAGV